MKVKLHTFIPWHRTDVVSLTLRPLYSRKRDSGTFWTGGWEGLRGGLDTAMRRRRGLYIIGNRIPDVQTQSVSFYSLLSCYHLLMLFQLYKM
jgi:hypothetical protein